MRNVLLITVDSLRADHVGCYGHSRETTPAIDRLAAEGHRFENAFAHACATRTSFPSILTSATALMYGGYERLSERRTLLTEALPTAYHTAGFHSNLYLSAEFGYGRGFDRFFDSKPDPSGMARLKQVVKNRLDDDGWLYGALAGAVDTAEKQAGINVGSAYVRADDITDRAIEFVDRRREGPRFLWAHYMDPHHPYLPPEHHQRALDIDPVGEREAIRLRRKMIEDPERVTNGELDTLRDLYGAEIRFTDVEIGRLVERVREQWGEDTLVVLTADHGEEFREHGEFSHTQTFHDEVLHVPFVVDTGANSADMVHDELVGLLDVTPTIVDYANGEQSSAFYGHSLRPLLEDELRGNGDRTTAESKEWPREHVVGDWADGEETRFAYRDTRWKYIDVDGTVSLYDLEVDPGETADVAADHPEECDRIRRVIAAHKEEISATDDDLGTVEMDVTTKERLRDLGYAE